MSERKPNFFILGSQRSGTTLLRLMLNSHSEVAIPEEGTFLRPFLEKPNLKVKCVNTRKYLASDYQFKKWGLSPRRVINITKESGLGKEIFHKCYNEYGKEFNKKIVGDKTPPFIKYLNSLDDLCPDSKYIHIIRDGRDCYLSLLSREHHSAISFVLGGFEWAMKNKKIQNFLASKGPDKRMIIRYEDILDNPESSLRLICEFLNINFEPSMLNFYENSSDFIDLEHSQKIFGKIDSSNKYKWKQSMTNSEIFKFELFSSKILENFDYDLNCVRGNKFLLLYSYLEFLAFLPIRLFRVYWIAFKQKVNMKLGRPSGKEFYV